MRHPEKAAAPVEAEACGAATTGDYPILPQGCHDWIVKNVDTIVDIVEYLRRNPLELLSLETAARLEIDGAESLLYTPSNPRAAQLAEARVRRVRDWLDSGKLGACPRCVAPVLYFGDGRLLDLKPIEHECGRRHAS